MRSTPSPWLLTMVTVTVLLSVLSAGLPAVTDSPLTTGNGEIRLYVDVLEENNLPTWWATAVLVLAAAAGGTVAGLSTGGQRRRWTVLTVLIALLSLDEMTSLHERLDRLVAGRVDLGTYPFLWLVPGAALGLLVFAGVVSAVRTAPPPARAWLLGGFGLLLAAALGGELLQGFLLARASTGPAYVLTYHAEEAGETLGAIALLNGAVQMLRMHRDDDGVRIRVDRTGIVEVHRRPPVCHDRDRSPGWVYDVNCAPDGPEGWLLPSPVGDFMTARCQHDDPTCFHVQASPAPTGWGVTVHGDVDAGTAPRLGDLLLDVLGRPGAATVDLDLRDVTFLDSAGLTALVAAHQAAQRGGQLLRVHPGTSRAVVRPLTITGLMTVLDIADPVPAPDRHDR